MKKIMLIGHIACGKTTLCQRLNGLKQEYKKTQVIEVINHTIDTPGEYTEVHTLAAALAAALAKRKKKIVDSGKCKKMMEKVRKWCGLRLTINR